MRIESITALAIVAVLAVLNGQVYAGDAHSNFSADDSRLVCMSDGDIKIVEIKTGKVTNLTNSPTADMCPDWSNDGMRIVFDSQRSDPERDLYMMAIDGTKVQRLTDKPGQEDKCPAFSPDDSTITYICTVNGDMDIFFDEQRRHGSKEPDQPSGLGPLSLVDSGRQEDYIHVQPDGLFRSVHYGRERW